MYISSRTILLGIVPRATPGRRISTTSSTPGPSLEVAGDAISPTAAAVARTGSIAAASSARCCSTAIGIVPAICSRVFCTNSDVADRTEEAGVGGRPEGGGEGPLDPPRGPDGLQTAAIVVDVDICIGICVACGPSCSSVVTAPAAPGGRVRILLLAVAGVVLRL